MIADYERFNFSVSQCLFKEDNPEQIIAIHSPLEKHNSSGLSHGALIAVVVSVTVLVMIFASCAYIYFRVKKKRRGGSAAVEIGQTPTIQKHISDISELASSAAAKHSSNLSELGSRRTEQHAINASELVSKEMRHELATLESPIELQGSPVLGW